MLTSQKLLKKIRENAENGKGSTMKFIIEVESTLPLDDIMNEEYGGLITLNEQDAIIHLEKAKKEIVEELSDNYTKAKLSWDSVTELK